MWFGHKARDLQSQINELPQELKAAMALCSLDMQGKVTAATDLFISCVGEQKVIGKPLLSLLNLTEADNWQSLARKLPLSGEASTKDERQFNINLSSSPLQPGYLLQLLKANPVQAQDNDLQEAVNACFGVAEFSASGQLLSANAGFQMIARSDFSSLQGRHIESFCVPEDKSKIMDTWSTLAPCEPHQDVLRWQLADGQTLWVQSNLIPIINDQLAITGVRQFVIDITEMMQEQQEAKWQLGALSQSQAIIEFKVDGTILSANDNFLEAMGYQLADIQGRHHRIFMPTEDAETQEYRNFWSELADGRFFSGEFRRKNRQGEDVWIQASYNPIRNDSGEVIKVIKFASDITAKKIQSMDYQGKIQAIGRSQAVIEFTPEGNIITANDNFLSAMGYSLAQIQGKHHRIFMPAADVASPAYQTFWQELRQGQFSQGEFKRVTSRGQDVWIQASYNPILDDTGKVVKVVKFASDITAQKLKNADFEGQIKAIGRSQAVIEFAADGTILQANDNFLNGLGYRLDEIKGRHHRMFVSEQERNSQEYQAFWQKLGNGDFFSGEFMRINKQGSEIWIQASYNPILDETGKVLKVVKYASDITAQKQAVTAIMEAVMAMSGGDLTCKLPTNLDGEFGKLAQSMNKLLDELNTMVNQIREASENVLRASGEISQSNTDLSQRTESQAAGLQQTAAAMESLTKLVSRNANQASEATTESAGIARQAKEGQNVVSTTVQAMENIQTSSKGIADIIAVIDEIAFQTNLLALNASVEAARAGELGRGFAVVASEVRNLAQRSANSAKEIKELINKSVDAVNTGSDLVAKSGNTFKQLVGAIDKISNMVDNIDEGSQEQSQGIIEINKAVSNMDSMVQQNVAMVEQATVASQSMKDQALNLQERVAFFKTASSASNVQSLNLRKA